MSSVAPTLSNQTPQSELIERIKLVFIASIYSMVCFANLTLMLAEGVSLWPHILVIPTAVICAYGIDLTSRFSLDGILANILGAAGIAMAAYEFSLGNEYRILSASHLLAYMSLAVMVLKKSISHYWWMCVLAILQLAIASALTNRPELGLAILVFLLLSLWTLAVFTLYRATKRFQTQTTPEAITTTPVNQEAIQSLRLPTNVHRRSFGIGMLQVGNSRSHWVKLTVGMMAIALASFVVAMVLFQTVPRINVGGGFRAPSGESSETFGAMRQAISGFSEEVSLGDMGPLLESVEPVMSVTFHDSEFDKPISVDEYMRAFRLEEMYFRGGSQEIYTNSKWKAKSSQNAIQIWRANKIPNAIVQKIQLEPITGQRLFFGYPFGFATFTEDYMKKHSSRNNTPSMEWKSNTHEIQLSTSTKAYDTIEYEVLFDKRFLNSNTKVEYLHLPNFNWQGRFGNRRNDIYRISLLDFSPTRFPVIQSMAEELMQAAQQQYGENLTQEQLARFIENHLKNSGQFQYSLNQTVIDTSIDPVEDFLKNRKEGHCEYYASALTLLLRACGIPARMATGFKGGNVTSDGMTIEVQQRHAHAWVEASVENRNWIVLDGTPYAREDSVAEVENNFGSLQNLGLQMKRFWTDRIMGVNFNSQRAQFYSPAIAFVETYSQKIQEQGILETLKQIPNEIRNSKGNSAVAIVLALLGVVLVGVLIGSTVSSRFRKSLWKSLRRKTKGSLMSNVEFFELYQKVLKQQGIVRMHHQTVSEFLDETSQWLGARLEANELSNQLLIPQHITEAYLKVRFGHQQLTAEENRRIHGELSQLSHTLRELTTQSA